MIFYISKNKEILCSSINEPAMALELKWDLVNNSIWYGNIKNGYDIEDKALHCFGCVPFLYEECGTILFNKENKKLEAIYVNISENYNVIRNKEINLIKVNENRSVILINKENFLFPDFSFPTYFVEKDIILLLDNEELSLNYECIDVDIDFSFIIEDKSIKGFIIENASQKTGLGIPPEQIARVLKFYTTDLVDKMDDCSEQIKNELIRLYHNQENSHIKGIYSNLLETYYHHNPRNTPQSHKQSYKTINGRDFTKEEWEAYEAEEYRK